MHACRMKLFPLGQSGYSKCKSSPHELGRGMETKMKLAFFMKGPLLDRFKCKNHASDLKERPWAKKSVTYTYTYGTYIEWEYILSWTYRMVLNFKLKLTAAQWSNIIPILIIEIDFCTRDDSANKDSANKLESNGTSRLHVLFGSGMLQCSIIFIRVNLHEWVEWVNHAEWACLPHDPLEPLWILTPASPQLQYYIIFRPVAVNLNRLNEFSMTN